MTSLLLSVLLACGASTEAPPAGSASPPVAGTAQATPMATSAPAAAAPAAVRNASVTELKTALDAGQVPLLVDVRTPEEFAAGHVPGAKNVPLDQLASRMGELEAQKSGELYVICQSGGRSARASQSLAAAGYRPVNIEGGTGAWTSAGFAVE